MFFVRKLCQTAVLQILTGPPQGPPEAKDERSEKGTKTENKNI